MPARVINIIPIIQCPLVDKGRYPGLKLSERLCSVPDTRGIYQAKFSIPCHEAGVCHPCQELPDTAAKEIHGNNVREWRAMKLRVPDDIYA